MSQEPTKKMSEKASKEMSKSPDGLESLVLDRGLSAGDDYITIAPGAIREVLTKLRENGFTQLVFITCVDHLNRPDDRVPFTGGAEIPRFELVYQVRNSDARSLLRVRAFLPESEPRVQSVHDLYGPANWDERETWDLFGVEFEGHPDLTRILLPEDWVGHPLRRDYPVGGEAVEFSEDHEEWQTTPQQA